MPSRRTILAAFIAVVCGRHATAKVEAPAHFRAEVVRVIDGDSLVVRWQQTDVEVRLGGIDAPELKQPGGVAAREALRAVAERQAVRVVGSADDRYGRRVAELLLVDGRSLNRLQVETGNAWHYREYAPDDATLAALEAWARDGRRGLWRTPNPQPPWEFRRAGRDESSPPASPRVRKTGTIVGNNNSRVYHVPGCPSYDLVRPQNRVQFDSPAAAESAGYRRAGNCPR